MSWWRSRWRCAAWWCRRRGARCTRAPACCRARRRGWWRCARCRARWTRVSTPRCACATCAVQVGGDACGAQAGRWRARRAACAGCRACSWRRCRRCCWRRWRRRTPPTATSAASGTARTTRCPLLPEALAPLDARRAGIAAIRFGSLAVQCTLVL